MNNLKGRFVSCFGYSMVIALFVLLVILLSIFGCCGYVYYKLTKTNEFAEYLSHKLSKSNKYSITIESFKNTLPIITANNVNYNKISDVSTLTVDVKELNIYPDYISPKTGTHTFSLNDAKMFLKSSKFLMDSKKIQLFGHYSNKNIHIASSTWDVFGGKIYLKGDVNCNQRPSSYDIDADLIYVRLEEILAGTKNKGLYTGNVYGKLKLKNYTREKNSIEGNASLSITNGTYYKPELVLRINKLLRKIGMKSTLKNFAENIGSSSFSLNGDFEIKDKAYKTENAELRTPWSFIKFSGTIGPKSALNGTFIVKIKDYSDFKIKVIGSDNKNLTYKISDSDKAKLASIFIREVSKGTEKQIKNEGRKTNKHFNRSIDKIGNKFKSLFKR